jgi:sarcosine oxidase
MRSFRSIQDEFESLYASQLRLASTHFDVVVIGLGSMGTAACYHLATSGLTVLGLEQFGIPHQHGSHSGQSRIIRKAYAESPLYVPMLEHAYRNWEALEYESDTELFFKTGLLYGANEHSPFMNAARACSKQFGISLKEFKNEQRKEHFPQFEVLASNWVLEPDAGFLSPERSILAHCISAIKSGAYIIKHEPVMDWEVTKHVIQVNTAVRTITCDKLVITAGPWAASLLPKLSTSLATTLQHIAWFDVKNTEHFKPENFPCWVYEKEGYPGIFYGFPIMPKELTGKSQGLKIAHHYPGSVIDNPLHVTKHRPVVELEKLTQIAHEIFGDQINGISEHSTCIYTNSPDDDFIIDFYPETDNRVAIAAGFSGHGFKFASAIGEVLKEMVQLESISADAGFLKAKKRLK